jgi:5-methylcytosine-specific restriction protein A
MRRAPRICPCNLTIAAGELCPCERRRTAARHRADSRPSARKRGYDREWQKLRAKHLRDNPACIVCGAKATTVDHIRTVKERPELRLDPLNLKSMCASCHSRKTAKEDGGFGRTKKRGPLKAVPGGAIETFERLRGPSGGPSRAIFSEKRTNDEEPFSC